MDSKELDRLLEVARAAPGIAHLLLAYPEDGGPVCGLCGGRSAPIIDGKHLSPETFCEV